MAARNWKLVSSYRSAWLPHEPDQIQFGTRETREPLVDLASRMLTAFLASDQARVSGRVPGVEEEIRGMLVEGVPDLYGRVDLLTEDTDSLVVTDIKTSREKRSPEQVTHPAGESGDGADAPAPDSRCDGMAGNSPQIAMKHYCMVPEEDFNKVRRGTPGTGPTGGEDCGAQSDARTDPNAAQQPHATPRSDSHVSRANPSQDATSVTPCDDLRNR